MAKVSEEMLASFAKIEDGLAKFVRNNESQRMVSHHRLMVSHHRLALSVMADKIQRNAKEVTSTKDRLQRAETRYDDLEIRHSSSGNEEEKCTIAVVMKRVNTTIGTYKAEIAGNTNAINALDAEVKEMLMGMDNMAATPESSNKRRKTVADEDMWN
jgi:hypothetical protein